MTSQVSSPAVCGQPVIALRGTTETTIGEAQRPARERIIHGEGLFSPTVGGGGQELRRALGEITAQLRGPLRVAEGLFAESFCESLDAFVYELMLGLQRGRVDDAMASRVLREQVRRGVEQWAARAERFAEWCALQDAFELGHSVPERFIAPAREVEEEPSPFTPSWFEAMRWLEEERGDGDS